jgi:hypothetical protein
MNWQTLSKLSTSIKIALTTTGAIMMVGFSLLGQLSACTPMYTAAY